ncbi:uncharacterized protein LOC126320405 [Schistocerca gregaria]|uniref:uncharacterized protein LOC126320405 n=1 Tax=Schistocerca gregaria TaxID=7010 RepID=UPI00211EB5EB|nr:uncharacterized protein LOC126320405 [Schistocerca gregaria]
MDVNFFREDKGCNPDMVRESQRRRFAPIEHVDEVIALDLKWRKSRYECDQAKKNFSNLNKQIAEKKKKKEDASMLLNQTESLKQEVVLKEEAEKECRKKLDEMLDKIGNIVHESVPFSNNEDDNEIVRTWGERRPSVTKHTHDILLGMVDGFDPIHGSKVAGHRGYYLTGAAVALNQALINYGLSFLFKRQYKLIQTPIFLNKHVMSKVAQLTQFDEELYKVTGDGDEKYLIATSEQPIAALHIEEWINPKSLPLRYAGLSTCMRKEAGAHGKDVTGIFRVHQFEKIEQFVVTAPTDSWEMHEEMLGVAEEFYQSLNLPYRVVNIVSGELNMAAAKKYDIEGWFPESQRYRELVSCSNCTDYQARKLEARYGTKDHDQHIKQYVHMLNATLCATGRTICCILENYETEHGIEVPLVLQPFMEGFLEDKSLIPFAKVPATKHKCK